MLHLPQHLAVQQLHARQFVPIERPLLPSAGPAPVASFSGRCICGSTACGCQSVAGAANRRSRGSACRASRGRSGSSSGGKGFGAGSGRKAPAKVQEPLAFQDDESEAEDKEQVAQELKPHYQMYTDPDYAAQRFVGDVEVAQLEGRGRGLVTSSDVLPGDLLVVSSALALVEGGFEEAPESEDLHVSMLEDGLPPHQRRVLDLLYDGTPASASRQASMSTLDPKFWQGRGGKDSSAPAVEASRLMDIISNCACADTTQDPASMQARHQKPVGFVGLWPEFSMLNHSCVPNTATTVVGDRMFIHATGVAPRGTELTRNYLGATVTAPLAVRRAELQTQFGFHCRCPRCSLEERVSDELCETLEAAYSWYTNEATELWNDANAHEDESSLRGLLEEVTIMVNEVETALAAERLKPLSKDTKDTTAAKDTAAAASQDSKDGKDGQQEEEGVPLSDYERLLLRASVYDVYDVLVTCDELVNKEGADPDYLEACLDIIRAFAPGSDSHLQITLKHQGNAKLRFETAQQMMVGRGRGLKNLTRAETRRLTQLARNAEMSVELMYEAFVLRYGIIPPETIEKLQDGMATYLDGLQQLSLMEADGRSETVREIEINGVKVNIVDRVDIGSSGSSSAEGRERTLLTKDGITVSMVEQEARSAAARPSSSRLDHDGDIIDVEALPAGGADEDEDDGEDMVLLGDDDQDGGGEVLEVEAGAVDLEDLDLDLDAIAAELQAAVSDEDTKEQQQQQASGGTVTAAGAAAAAAAGAATAVAAASGSAGRRGASGAVREPAAGRAQRRSIRPQRAAPAAAVEEEDEDEMPKPVLLDKPRRRS